ncbi:MAG: ATP phosphoribosyltransferase regulatory subunit [Lachnospiraceae bacterium]|jgi:ATP phosphoribosyltransferase regulatory subunit
MKISLLHTPEGVRDVYGEEYDRKQAVSARITEVIRGFGYSGLQTPVLEYFDIFSAERGSVASNELFKLFDRDGNTMVLRPDITPAAARCISKYYMYEELPVRLYYEGSTFVNSLSLRGSLKESSVIGAEFVNDASADADAEIIAMLISCLRAAGLTDFQVEIGLVDYFNGLMQDASLSEENQARLRELIESKNFFGVEEMLAGLDMDDSVRTALSRIPKLFGGIEQIRKARELTNNARALSALDRLEKLYAILSVYGLEKFVSFDLGMLGKFNYYTGIIFKAYTYGTGSPVATGGRYDNLLAQFGKKAPATGFAIYLDDCLTAMRRQNIPVDTGRKISLIVYEQSCFADAVREAEERRSAGARTALVRRDPAKPEQDYQAYAAKYGMGSVTFITPAGEKTCGPAEEPAGGQPGNPSGGKENG